MSVTPQPVIDALNALQSTITAAGTLQGASDAVLAPVVASAIACTTEIAVQIETTDDMIDTTGSGLVAGTPANLAVAWLNAQIAANQTQYNLLTIQSYVTRVELNIASRI